MNDLFDMLLGRPLPMEVLRFLLFAAFALHMLFVLFTIGTAILSVYYYLRARFGGDEEAGAWLHRAMDAFLAHKSLAVVLGIAPLLLIQVGFTIPFFTAVNLFAPYWLGIILCLIISFLALDYVGRNYQAQPWLRTGLALGGLALLLLIPGVFVAVLTTTENSGQWISIMRNGYRLSGGLALHWLARYAHVIAAGIIFAGLFFTFVTQAEEAPRRRALLRWAIGGIVAQAFIGVGLYFSLPARPDLITQAAMGTGIMLALVLLVLARRGQIDGRMLRLPVIAPIGLALLIAMLLTRQSLQDRGVLPLNEQMTANAAVYQAMISPHHAASINTYETMLDTPYGNAHNAYTLSCSFCHGATGGGNGIEAQNLTIRPEVVAAIRTTRPYLRARLTEGVNGSAMPYFTIYTNDQLNDLIDYLDQSYGTFSAPGPVTAPVSPAAEQQAAQTFTAVCATCHGADGSGKGPVATGLLPPPPDFRQFSLTPQRAFQVISEGYTGTAMLPNSTLPEEVRWGLVKYVTNLRKY
jgi:mono/diheme cytochrome c family protein